MTHITFFDRMAYFLTAVPVKVVIHIAIFCYYFAFKNLTKKNSVKYFLTIVTILHSILQVVEIIYSKIFKETVLKSFFLIMKGVL